MNRVKGKRIVLFGANGGIGAASARLLAAEGAELLLSDLAPAPAAGLPPAAEYLAADVANADEIRAVLSRARERFGQIDVLLICAGIGDSRGFLETDEAHFDRIIAIDLRGPFLCARAAVELMGPGAGIVLVSSQKGLVGSTGSIAYNAAKAGLVIMGRSMALELGPLGIRVNCLCPGPTDTGMFREDMSNQADPAATRRKVASCTAVDRIGNAEEIAWGALFLASDESSYMTGTELVMDGGNIAGVRNI